MESSLYKRRKRYRLLEMLLLIESLKATCMVHDDIIYISVFLFSKIIEKQQRRLIMILEHYLKDSDNRSKIIAALDRCCKLTLVRKNVKGEKHGSFWQPRGFGSTFINILLLKATHKMCFLTILP